MKWDGKIPFDHYGNLMFEAIPPGVIATTRKGILAKDESRAHEWKHNWVFKGTLRYTGYHRGRTTVLVKFTCLESRRRLLMFMRDFDEAIRTFGFNGQDITGTWTFVKRGRNFGVKAHV